MPSIAKIRFHTAGQGLFSTGSVELENNELFEWVYDCGSSSGKNSLSEGIYHYHNERLWQGRSQKDLDLVVLSHFDMDHVNGVVELLANTGVRWLMLPLVPLATRLLLASTKDVVNQTSYFSFLLDPGAYLREHATGGEIQEIIWVPPSRGESTSQQDVTLGEPNDQGVQISPRPARIDTGQVELSQGGRILVGRAKRRAWEFVPYYPEIDADDVFLNSAKNLADDLQFGKTKVARQKALAALKSLYRQKFRTAELRNLISVFLYAGPEGNGTDANMYLYERVAGSKDHNAEKHIYATERASLLYTGDGYLNTEARYLRLGSYLQWSRMSRISILQVMHHGSAKNWHQGIAGKLSPLYSVFSSDPNAKDRHPDGRVLQDFWAYGPVRVDKSRFAKFCIEYV